MFKTIACLSVLTASAAASIVACSSSSSDTGVQADAGVEASAPDASTALTWTWQNVDGAKCRDGSSTGIGVNLNPASTKVMIFLEGGGACFNTTTCSGNPSKYGESDFNATVASAGASGFNGSFDTTKTNGIMSRNDPKNPVADWNLVYIPYCTGDLHGGDNPTGTVTGVTGTQQFVGRHNLDVDLAAIKALLPNTSQVLLSGMSGGGFGTVLAYDQVATFWGGVPVDMIDDSGPPMADPYLPSCLQTSVVTLWGLDKTTLVDCGADCLTDPGDGGTATPDVSHFAIKVMKHIVKKYPQRHFGLIESTDDFTITSFFGFGAEDCTTFLATLEPTFTAGLLDIRSELSAYPNFGSFYFGGADYQKHTSYEGSLDERMSTDQTDAGGTPTALSDWTAKMISGTVTNVGP